MNLDTPRCPLYYADISLIPGYCWVWLFHPDLWYRGVGGEGTLLTTSVGVVLGSSQRNKILIKYINNEIHLSRLVPGG